MSGDVHVRFCESRGVRFPPATHLVAHCGSEAEAQCLQADISQRLRSVGLELHPDKTKVVYCKDGKRTGEAEHTSFDFLGYTFQRRPANGRHGHFVSFLPALSDRAKKVIGKRIRDWHLKRRSRTDLAGLAAGINARVRGWISYYGAFYRSRLHFLAMRIDEHLVRWAMQKYKRLRGKRRKAYAWLHAAHRRQPWLFAHWQLVPFAADRPVGAV